MTTDKPSLADFGAPASALPAARGLIAAVVLALAVAAVYGQALSSPFIFDDQSTIVNNRSIRQLWPLVGTSATPGPLRPPPQFSTAGRPLVNLTLAINYRLGEFNPWGYHVFNLAVHALNAWLLWALLRQTLLLPYFDEAYSAQADWLALAVALLWAVHPLQTEAVQYVTQRTELLVATCYLATLLTSLQYWLAKSAGVRLRWLAAATLACTAGMACKEVMVTAPVVVLLYQYTFFTGSFRRALRDSGPLYAGLALGWVLLLALNLGGPRSDTAGFHLGVRLLTWWYTQAKVLLLYVQLVFWPWPLVIHYDIPYLETFAAGWRWVVMAALVLTATCVLVRQRTTEGFVAATALLTLLPTLVTPIITEIAAERRMYLASAAILALVIAGSYQYVRVMLRGAKAVGFPSSPPIWLTALAVAVVLAVSATAATVSIRRLSAYHDLVTIWQDTLLHQPTNPKVYNNLGVALVAAGRHDEAVQAFKQAVRLRPEFAEARFNLAAEMRKAGRHEEAVANYESGLQFVPDYAEGRYELGAELFALNRRDDAIEQLRHALRLGPRHVEANYLLAQCQLDRGDVAGARQLIDTALQIAPHFAPAHRLLGDVLVAEQDLVAAEREYRTSLELWPQDAWALDNFGVLLLKLGKPSLAIEQFTEALRCDPHYHSAREHLDEAQAQRDRSPETAAPASVAP